MSKRHMRAIVNLTAENVVDIENTSENEQLLKIVHVKDLFRLVHSWIPLGPRPYFDSLTGRKICNIRFYVLTAVTANNTVFWDVTPYNLVEAYEHFVKICYLQLRFFLAPWNRSSSEVVFYPNIEATDSS
jgi:hypothetical protein